MLNDIYAKSDPDKTLIDHMIDSGCVAIELLKTNTFKSSFNYLYNNCNYENKSNENFLNWIGFMVSLHDLGKCDIKFQCLLPTKDKFGLAFGETRIPDLLEDQNFRHEIYGAERINILFNDCNYNSELSVAIHMHHQKINAKHHPEIQYPSYRKYNEKQEQWQMGLISELKQVFQDVENIKKVAVRHKSTWWMLFAGILILSDWISSSADFIVTSESAYKDASSKTARELINKYGLSTENEMENFESFEACFGISKENMREIQFACEEKLPSDSKFVIIEAPTGEGKTEAALYSAYKMCIEQKKSGIYVALPTAATSNQMYGRVKSFLNSNGNVKLIHSNAWLLEDNAFFESKSEEAIHWLSSTKKAILCQNAVGTVDQIMKSVMRVKYSMLKMLGLENKVVIIDEVHAYDSYMKSVIVKMLTWLKALEVPVIMLSATLPESVKKEYLGVYMKKTGVLHYGYPLITYVNDEVHEIECSASRSEQIKTLQSSILDDYDMYSKLILEKAKENGYICCICNTVKAAQKTYDCIKKHIPANVKLFLLHSRFSIEDRSKIEQELNKIFSKQGIEERPKSCILISTQIVEQSLDFDFDYIFTEIAPIDLLLQRFGRLKRFSNLVKRSESFSSEIKEATVFIPPDNDFGDLSYIYYTILLEKTLELLNKKETIELPGETRYLIDYVYEKALDKEHLTSWSGMYADEKLKELYATSSVLPDPDDDELFLTDSTKPIDDFCKRDDDDYTVTRISDNSARIVFIESQDEADKGASDFKIAKTLHLKSIGITIRDKAITPIPIEGKGYVKGLSFIVTSDKTLKIGKSIYQYDSENGLKKN